MPGYLFIVFLLAVLWVFLIRPRQRQLRTQQQQLASLQVGDEIVTAGGLYGTVQAIADDEVQLEIAPQVTVRVAKRAVAAILTEHGAEPEPVEESADTLSET